MVFPLQPFLTLTKTLISLSFLSYASWSDYKTREVNDTVWILFAPIAFTLTAIEIILYEDYALTSTFISYAISFGLTTFFALILLYAGGYGGADAKALMCLALALPFYPEKILMPFSGDISPISKIIFPLTVFNNSILLASTIAVCILLYNIIWHRKTGRKLFDDPHKDESMAKKLLILITGYRIPVSKLKEKWHLYPLEDVEQTPNNGLKRKLVVFPSDENREAIVKRLEQAINEEKMLDMVWTSPGLPMLIFITVGLLLALFFGDIIWILITHIL